MTTPTGRDAFSAQDARAYWDQRHATTGALVSGGYLGISEELNAQLYAVRQARLIEALDGAYDRYLPLHVLDAGCGKGHFARSLASYGHRVDGIDTSSHAIGFCQELAGPRESYAVSALDQWRPPYLYDAVICIDVLFHIMDDAEWAASLANLASLVRFGGRLVVADHHVPTDRMWSHYQKTRASGRYESALAGHGLALERFLPNAFRDDPVGLYIAQRVA